MKKSKNEKKVKDLRIDTLFGSAKIMKSWEKDHKKKMGKGK